MGALDEGDKEEAGAGLGGTLCPFAGAVDVVGVGLFGEGFEGEASGTGSDANAENVWGCFFGGGAYVLVTVAVEVGGAAEEV